MTIETLTTPEVKNKFSETLEAWGNPDNILSPSETTAELQKVRTWAAANSPTANGLLKKADDAAAAVILVAFAGGGQTVFSASEGVVFWNTTAKFTTNKGKSEFHNYVALMHEFGHFVQWKENPEFFEGCLVHNFDAIKDAARQFYLKAAAKSGMVTHKDKMAFVNQRMQDPKKNAGLAWAVRVEMDNLNRHEWPICKEAKLPLRLEYTDLQSV